MPGAGGATATYEVPETPANHRVLGLGSDRQTRTQLLLRAAATALDETDAKKHRDEVIRLNMTVATAVARRFQGRGIALEDLEQVAYVGLIQAAQRYDVTRDKDFLAYAVPTMTGTVKRYFRDHGWVIRPPRPVQEVQTSLLSARADLTAELGRSPRPREVAQRLGVDEELVLEALALAGHYTPTSLDKPVGAGHATSTTTLGDLLASHDTSDQDAAEARLLLAPALRNLDERDRQILRLRFFEEQTQAEIGAVLGVTQIHISRRLARILRDLRRGIDGHPRSDPI